MSTSTTVHELVYDADNLMMADEPVKNARQQFELETMRSLILVDASGPVGLLTRARMREIAESEFDVPAREFAVPTPVLRQSQTLEEVRDILGNLDFDADRIPVVNDDGRLVGVVHRDAIKQEAETIVTGRGTVAATDGSGLEFPVEIGMDVLSVDDDKLGKLDEIVLSRNSVESIVVAHGLLGRHHKRVSADHIRNANDETVYLDFGKSEFNLLANVEDREEDEAQVTLS